uniref:Cytochrome d ubiquinol oxidase subunit II n=1 Tax=Caldimicrobium thiodismutans TaxID=1653476 RepID=A0A832LUD9_9BACT
MCWFTFDLNTRIKGRFWNGLFPNLLPSSLNPAYSLTIYNSSSSLLTLRIMTIVALLFVPVVLLYTYWSYKTFAHRLSKEDISY